MSERIVILGRGVSGQAAALLAEKIGAAHTFVCDGDAGAARAIGEAMKAKGSVAFEDYVDFFDYEGNRYGSTKDAKNAANAYTKALGELLLGDKAAAHVDFARCLDLKPNHLWAKVVGDEF